MYKIIIIYLLFTILFPLANSAAQTAIPDNAAFTTESIIHSLNELNMSEKVFPDKTYRVQRSKTDSLSAFVSIVVFDFLKEQGYKTFFNNKEDNPESDLFLRIIEPMLKLDVKDGTRRLDGEFILLLYSVEAGKLNWGEEIQVKFGGEDNVKGRSLKQLNRTAPGFLQIENRVVFSGKKFDKILAATVAGIITFLFYSVRG